METLFKIAPERLGLTRYFTYLYIINRKIPIMNEDNEYTLKELEELLTNLNVVKGFAGKAHTKRNVARNQYITWIKEMIKLRKEEEKEALIK